MVFVSGPERDVRTPGASEIMPSNELAYVMVTNGRSSPEECCWWCCDSQYGLRRRSSGVQDAYREVWSEESLLVRGQFSNLRHGDAMFVFDCVWVGGVVVLGTRGDQGIQDLMLNVTRATFSEPTLGSVA